MGLLDLPHKGLDPLLTAYMHILAPVQLAPATITIGGVNGTVSVNSEQYRAMMAERERKLAETRKKAIQLRNQMLGEKGWRELYSPGGLHIPSKKWPGREYVFYSSHGSVQVFDRGVNIGRMDMHIPNPMVPFGDEHLAQMLAYRYDEERTVKMALFTPVRDHR